MVEMDFLKKIRGKQIEKKEKNEGQYFSIELKY